MGDGLAAAAGFGFLDDAGIEIGIDGHLLTGHGVQGKSGGDFSDTSSALGDNDELNNDDDNEDNHTHRQRIAADELSERFNDTTGGFHGGFGCQSSIARGEDQSRGGGVQYETEEGYA